MQHFFKDEIQQEIREYERYMKLHGMYMADKNDTIEYIEKLKLILKQMEQNESNKTEKY